ncbi:hypothetical protein L1987_24778 [Smallanthus sonchifolius]|uniref:Uncharacterized protein n=1 Tax=Smallanthus sonchifolius TaxID=185202 RepID=A0ACB9ILZ2_9ASTR|nr:hypothetical protein L1987_24778 [Smallanthus sonchifolius]
MKTELRECKEEVKDLRLEVGSLHTQFDVQQTQLETQQKIISQQQQDFKALSDIVEQLKASMTKESVEVKIEETDYDFPSASERRATRERGKGKESSVDAVILDEEEVGSDHELDELQKQVDDFGTIEDYPEIVILGEEQGDKLKYFIEEGNEFDAPSDNELEDQNVTVTFVEPVNTAGPTSITKEAPTPIATGSDTPSVQASNPRRSWFKEMQAQEPPKHYEWFAEYQELKRPPVGWKYDKERSLFIVRRYKGGVEHFKSPHNFSSLPKYDLRALTKLPLQNPRDVGIARDFETFFRNQTFNDFRSITTAKPRRVISKTRIHPITQRPWIFSEDDEVDAKAYQRVVTINAKPHFQKPSQKPTA